MLTRGGASQSTYVDCQRSQLSNQRVHDAGRVERTASEDVQRQILQLGIGVNGGMGFLEKNHPRKPRATLDEVMLHAVEGVKAGLVQRFPSGYA